MLAKIGLIPRLVICIVLGILAGLWGWYPLMAVLATFNQLFGQLLGFVIPLIILSFIVVGIADIGKGAGKMLGGLVTYAYGLTVVAGFLGYFVIALFQPLVVEIGSAVYVDEARAAVEPLINLVVAPVMPVMTALVFAFLVGAFMVNLGENSAIEKGARQFQDIIKQVIAKVIIPMLPIHIAGIFARIAYQGQAAVVLGTFLRVFIVIIILHWAFILVQYIIAGAIYKISPFKLLKPMIGSYLTALGTQSSAATMPVNLTNVKRMGVEDRSANFVVPLCTTINLPGSMMSIVACAVAVMFMFDMPISPAIMAPFMFTAALTMVAAPGVPGGAIMAAVGALQLTLGFDEMQIALMIALYIAQDSFGTAVNVTSDGAATLYLNRIMGNKKLDYKG